MELILRQDVENLGFKDDLVIVKNGYGRNFLIPQGFATLATSSAKKVLAENLKQKAYKEEKLVNEANEIAKALLDLEIKITAKTGAGTKLFGSVNNMDIVEALKKDGHTIEKKFIKVIGGSVKRTGRYEAKVRLHRSVVVDLPFDVIAEEKK